jgi:cytochrome c oxidase subunit II
MFQGIPIQPEQASSIARQVDYLYYFLSFIAIFFSVVIFSAVFYFSIRYRRRQESMVPKPIHGSLPLELAWSIGPGLICMFIFAWASILYFRNANPPEGSMEIYVVGKQWMWKLQHPGGQREINELHVPVGRPVKLVMTSEDVVHSFFVPAFRVKKDVVPGTYTTVWFQADQPGQYHLFCTQYCGTQHSQMIGWVYVMQPRDYEKWLSGGGGGNMASSGERLFQRLGCQTCHVAGGGGRGPSLPGIYGKPVLFEDGTKAIADDDYIRESILNPAAKVVAGYKPVMPTFQGQVSEEQILQLIAYIKSLTKEQAGTAGSASEGLSDETSGKAPGKALGKAAGKQK